MAPILVATQALLCQRAFERAAEAALDALDLDRTQPDAHWLLGTALAFYGDLPQARQSLELGLRFDGKHLECLRTASVVERASGNAEAADRLRQRAAAAALALPPIHQQPLPFMATALAAHLGVSE
jgi:tetratricopeptide (TPR) repeat protein